MSNPNVQLTLEDAVMEVLQGLTGLEVTYQPTQERFQAITRVINRALRAVALEAEWSFYASTEDLGVMQEGQRAVEMNSTIRPRIINDDAVRLVDNEGVVHVWGYFLPREALHKYGSRRGFWVSVTRSSLQFSRPILGEEAGLRMEVSVMREPKMFRLPTAGRDIPRSVLTQAVDFDYPDLIVAKAMQLYAETDPVMQPRAQTLEARYKDLMYQLIERDERATDTPYTNDFFVPIIGGLNEGYPHPAYHGHPHADERTF